MKTVLVTGGSSGIGKSLVRLFAKEGYKVCFTYRSGKKSAYALVEEIGSDKTQAFHWDAADVESLESLVSSLPAIDILINNAGLGSATVQAVTEDILKQDEALMMVNAVSPLWLIRKLLPGLKERGGKIINMASVGGGITQFPGFHLADGMSKAAMVFMTKQLAAEMAYEKVDVYAVCPGATETPMFGKSTLDNLSSEQKNQLLEKLPARRLINPDEIAELVLFLASDSAKVLRGSILDASLGLGVNPGLLQK